MFLLCIIMLEFVTVVKLLQWGYLYWVVVVALVYALRYFDGSEYTGRMTWYLFRRLSIWKRLHPIQCVFGDKKDFTRTDDRRNIFLVGNSETFAALFWVFGLHGGIFPQQVDVCYVMPWIMFKVPLVREVLLWSGAVACGGRAPSARDVALNMLNRNRSVALPLFEHRFCGNSTSVVAAGTHDGSSGSSSIDGGGGGKIGEERRDAVLFQFAKSEKVSVVPVVVHGEHRRYLFPLRCGVFDQIRWQCYTRTGHRFPVCYLTNIFYGPPPKIRVAIGGKIRHDAFESANLLHQHYNSTYNQLKQINDPRSIV